MELKKEHLLYLVFLAKEGDKDAFAELYKYYLAPIFRFIFFRVRNYSDAEDLTQTVFLKAWNSILDYQQKDAHFSSWLYTIARNALADFWKKKREVTVEVLDDVPYQEKRGDDNEENIKLIEKVIELLTEDQQELIILKFIQDLSNREIAEIMNKSEEAIRQIQSRAIKKIRENLKDIWKMEI